MDMIERITVRIFFVCMFSCAILFLVFLWFASNDASPWFRLVPTLFVIGLSNFLTWVVCMVYKFYKAILEK